MSRKNRQRQSALKQQPSGQGQIPPQLAQLINPSTPPQLIAQFMASLQVSAYSGPIPPPEILQKYNEIEPGLADRIVKMAEQQAQHRQTIEAKVIDDRGKNERLGSHYGFALALVAILGSFGLVYAGYDVIGITGLLGTIATLAGVFVYGRYSQVRENREKREAVVRRQDTPVPKR